MSISKVAGGIGAALLVSTLSIPALAGPSEALAACKADIAADARMAKYESVSQNTDNIKRRGRYTTFDIEVAGKDAAGEKTEWVARCKARNNGKVEELELTLVGGADGAQVAQSSN